MLRTEFIILRRTPYQESSLVVSGISPAFGRLDFLLKGALGQGPKKFPYAGLFRELSVEFQEKRSGSSLLYMKAVEPLNNYDGIANFPESYLEICEYAKFLLKHIRPMLEMPETYAALKTVLRRLSSSPGHSFDPAAAKLAFLHESGLVPEAPEGDPQRAAVLSRLLEYAVSPDAPMPVLQEEYQKRLLQWITALCRYADEA